MRGKMSKVEQDAGGDAENLEYVKAMAERSEAYIAKNSIGSLRWDYPVPNQPIFTQLKESDSIVKFREALLKEARRIARKINKERGEVWGAHKVVEAKVGAMCAKEKHAHCFVVRCTCWCHKRS
jgi:hypothetical protein